MSRFHHEATAFPRVAPVFLALAILALPLAAPARGGEDKVQGCKLVAHLKGDEETPVRDTLAEGQVEFKVSAGQEDIYYKLIASNIYNVVEAHLHLAPVGQTGPAVVLLAGPLAPGGGRHSGILAEGTITAASLQGPLAGRPVSALVAEMHAGNAYVNVHTDDGVAPPNTGPGDFPGGEIRGQIRPIGHPCPVSFFYFTTCGDMPVCRGWTPKPGIPLCTTQVEGAPCTDPSGVCDIEGDFCNTLIVCAASDPKPPQGCPISQRAAKRDIRYLEGADLARVHDDLMGIRLATYRYRSEGETGPERLGFLIDDVGMCPAVAENGRKADLYGYLSMAVAALQVQDRRIQELEREVGELRGKTSKQPPRRSPR